MSLPSPPPPSIAYPAVQSSPEAALAYLVGILIVGIFFIILWIYDWLKSRRGW